MPTFVCPICGRSVTVARLEEAPARPFCSLRCQQIDLGRWLTEEYRISEELPPDVPPLGGTGAGDPSQPSEN